MQKLPENLRLRGQAMLLIWIQFNIDNELANCVKYVDTSRWDYSKLKILKDNGEHP